MKKSILRKTILSGIATLSLAVSAVTSTFAFVILNDDANISEFNFNIRNEEGLWISLDGTYYSQDISYSMIKNAIERNLNPSITDIDNDGLISDEVGFVSLNDYIMNPVTMKANQTLVSLKSYVDRLGQNSSKLSFAYDAIKIGTDPSGANNIWYDHESKDAKDTDYISFDLWFRIINNGDVAKYTYTSEATGAEEVPYNYDLKFTTYTNISGVDNTIKLSNNLTTYNDLGAKVLYGPKVIQADDPETEEDESYDRTSITVNSADAMRLAVLNSYEYEDWKKAQEDAQNKDTTTKGLYVFETKTGLGSSAIKNEIITTNDGKTDTYKVYGLDSDANDPEKNAMYTYYNSTHPVSPFTSGATYNESFSTISTYTNTVLGTFDYQANNTNTAVPSNYSVVKLSLAIYLEGWDADYLYGVSTNSLNVTLGFKINQIYNKLKDPTKG